MSFQGKEFSPEMKQMVINLKEFNDIERQREGYKAIWAIEQTAKGLGIGEATVRRIMAEFNKNRRTIPASRPTQRGKPEYTVPSSFLPIVRKYIRSLNLGGSTRFCRSCS